MINQTKRELFFLLFIGIFMYAYVLNTGPVIFPSRLS